MKYSCIVLELVQLASISTFLYLLNNCNKVGTEVLMHCFGIGTAGLHGFLMRNSPVGNALFFSGCLQDFFLCV